MLSKSAARNFFIVGTVACAGAFILLTVDTIQRVPAQTNRANLTESAIRGKHLFDRNNCMGCHTILGEGAYYAPELTKVFERRGPAFITAMLKDPQAMYPNARKMQKYDLSDQDITDLIEFFKWIGNMDLNGFPPKPDIAPATAAVNTSVDPTQASLQPPSVYGQMCVACHALNGSGGSIGPALDGIGDRRDEGFLVQWLKDPTAIKADSKMPKLPLSESDITALAKFLSNVKAPQNKAEDKL